MLPGLVAQGKPVKTVNLAGKQPVLRLVKADEMIKKGFAQLNIAAIIQPAAAIHQIVVLLFNGTDQQLKTVRTGNFIADVKLHPG